MRQHVRGGHVRPTYVPRLGVPEQRHSLLNGREGREGEGTRKASTMISTGVIYLRA